MALVTLTQHHHTALRHRHHGSTTWNNINKCIPRIRIVTVMFMLAFLYVRISVYLLRSNDYGGDNNGGGAAGDGTSKLSPAVLVQPGNQQQKQQQQQQHRRQQQELTAVETKKTKTNNLLISELQSTRVSYQDWRNLAVTLAGELPHVVIEILASKDPFGVRTFEQRLLQKESDMERFLTLQELQELFPCPSSSSASSTVVDTASTGRITLPDQRNHDKAAAFRNGTVPYFLFFQHLRKAGGTNFCSLAKDNLPRKAVPRYYCMPDYDWPTTKKPKKCAGCAQRFTNQEMVDHMKDDGHKIFGNEWDSFNGDQFFDLPATFATSFRRPLDRALSQFRFECIEDRGCKIKNVTQWWDKRARELSNVYVWTFSNEGVRAISIGTSPDHAKRRQDVMGKALDVVAKFNLVMVMEWLAYAPTHVREVLGFKKTSALTTRVRPHIGQAKREDGQDVNALGAAGIAKASWTPETYLPPELYKRMSLDLALDEILTDAARRMFLERIVCRDVDSRG